MESKSERRDKDMLVLASEKLLTLNRSQIRHL